MKFRRRHLPASFLLVPLLFSVAITSTDTSSPAASFVKRDIAAPGGGVDSTFKASPVGTKDAPVDGKDGLPHEGPFVETGAERYRKQTMESGDEEPATRPLSGNSRDQFVEADLPISNDGVMDDRNRLGPKAGTRGTEGGVSEKSRDGRYGDKLPGSPKEAPPLPHSEAEKIGSKDDTRVPYDDEDRKLLERPIDLPDKPHDFPPPEEPVAHRDASIVSDDGAGSYRNPKSTVDVDEEESAVIQPMHSLLLSFTMILFSEIGDKTFLVAALMAMRHDRAVVFSAAYSALVTMTVLSALLGHAVPTLIPKSITNFLASALFLVFGTRMLVEARKMSPDEGVSEEMKEVEMELEEKEHQQRRMSRRRSSVTPYMLESGRASGGGARKSRSSTTRLPSPPESPSSSPSSSRGSSPSRHSVLSNVLVGINNLLSLLLSPAWVQTFVMTFLGEWGDRSQIATIAMAAGQDYWWVTVGALGGHAICTAAAVLGGRAIAGRVSLKVVTMGGAIAFLVFGLIYLFEAIY